HVGDGAPLSEPMWFYLGFVRRPDATALERLQPGQHRIGIEEITHVRLTCPSMNGPSEVARAVMRAGVATLEYAAEHLLEITFDGGGHGSFRDFRPRLPLVCRW